MLKAAVLASALQLGCGPEAEPPDSATLGLEEPGELEPGPLEAPEAPLVMPEGDPQVTLQGWTPWVRIEGPDVTSDPSACTYGPSGSTLLFARGPDNTLIYTFRSLSTGRWASWRSLGGRLSGAPSAVCQVRPDGTGRYDVYAQGSDQGLHHIYSYPFFTSDWEDLSGLMAGMTGPAVAIHPTRRQDVLVHWQDGGLRHKYFALGWSGWMNTLPGTLRGDPAAVYTSYNRLDVVAVFSDGRVRHTSFENGVWQPWTTVPAAFTSSPELISTGPGEMHLFGRGPDNSLVHLHYANGVWGDDESLGGYLTSGPAATVYAGGRIMVFARGGDNKLYYRAWAP